LIEIKPDEFLLTSCSRELSKVANSLGQPLQAR